MISDVPSTSNHLLFFYLYKISYSVLAEPWAGRFFLHKTSAQTLGLSCKTNVSRLQKSSVCVWTWFSSSSLLVPVSTPTNSRQFQNPGHSKKELLGWGTKKIIIPRVARSHPISQQVLQRNVPKIPHFCFSRQNVLRFLPQLKPRGKRGKKICFLRGFLFIRPCSSERRKSIILVELEIGENGGMLMSVAHHTGRGSSCIAHPRSGAGGDPAHPREIFLGWDISMRPLGGLVAKI